MDFIKLMLQGFWYGIILNPYFLGILGGSLAVLLLIKRGVNRYVKWLSLLIILIMFITSLYVKKEKEAELKAYRDSKKQAEHPIIVEDARKALTERDYYIEYKAFRNSLEEISNFKRTSYDTIDSINFSLSIELEDILKDKESIVDAASTKEEINKWILTTEEKVSRVFFDYVDRKNNKFYQNIYLPLLDSTYNRLNKPNIFYIHEWRSRSSRDSTLWQFTIDYETNRVREKIKADYYLNDNMLVFRK